MKELLMIVAGAYLVAKSKEKKEETVVKSETLVELPIETSIESPIDVSLDIEKAIKDLQKDLHKPHRGRTTSWWQRGKSESRTRLYDQVNTEATSLTGAIVQQTTAHTAKLAQEIAPVEIRRQEAERQSQHELLLKQNEFAKEQAVYGVDLVKANAGYIDSDVKMEHGKKQAEDNNRISSVNAASLLGLGIDLVEKLALIREESRVRHQEEVGKVKELEQIKLNTRGEEYQQNQENIDRVKMEESLLRDKERDRLFGMYDTLERLLDKPKTRANQAKVIRMKKEIRRLEDWLDGGNGGLVQAEAATEGTGFISPPDGRPGDTDEDIEGEYEIST